MWRGSGWRWVWRGLFAVLLLGAVGAVAWFVMTTFGGPHQLDTTPKGVSDDTGKTPAQAEAVQAPKRVTMTGVTTQAAAASDFADPISFRLEIVDAAGKLVTNGS